MKTTIRADPRAPGAARAFVSTHLNGRTLPAGVVVADVVLIASELATNAVRAGAASVVLTLALNRRQLDLAVEDDGEGWPTLQRRAAGAPDDAPGGRGLWIVEQLTDRWQVTATKLGKRVTATWSAHASPRT